MLGGGGSVAIGQCISICMGHSGGDRYFILWSTVSGSRLPSDLVLLWMTRAGLVASPAVTQKVIQSDLVFLNGADLLCDCHKVMLCKSSGKYSEPI